MVKYIDPGSLEEMIRKMVKQAGRDEAEIRPAVMSVLQREEWVVGVPLEEAMSLGKVRAREAAVIEGIRRKGL